MQRVFLVGFPRSGTTLVQSILGAHPDVRTFPETHFYEGVVARTSLLRSRGFLRPDALRIRPRLCAAGLPWAPGLADVFSPFLQAWSDEFVRCLDGEATRSGASAWLEKSPGHFRVIPEITKAVPDVKFVHVLRTCRRVVASYRRAYESDPRAWGAHRFWIDRSPEGLARRWAQAVETTLAYLGDERHRIVVYDDVIETPETIAGSVFEWLGLDASESTLSGVLERRVSVAAQVVLKSEIWKAHNTNEIGQKVHVNDHEPAWTALSNETQRRVAHLESKIAYLRTAASAKNG